MMGIKTRIIKIMRMMMMPVTEMKWMMEMIEMTMRMQIGARIPMW